MHIGKECLSFEARGFYFFGSQVLIDVIESNVGSHYIPDFTVRPQTDCLVLLVTRQRFLAAYRASQFELGKDPHDRLEEGDLFSKEWEAAESQDLQLSLSGGPGLSNIRHLLKTKPLQDFRAIKQSPNSKIQSSRSLMTPPRPFSKSPQMVLRFLTNSPGPSRNYEVAGGKEEEEEEEEEIDEKVAEKKSLLLGMESGYTTTDSASGSAHNSRNNSPVVEV